MSIPYRIHTSRLILRCYQPTDAPLLKQSVDQSLEHLLPWMPWAKFEPTPLSAKVERLRLMRGQFDLDQDYAYGMFNQAEDLLIGSCGLHKRSGQGVLEIGYWLHVDHCGKGYALEASRVLSQVGFLQMGVDRMEIRCDPNNVSSQVIPRKLGYQHQATLKDHDKTTDGRLRDTMVWVMNRDDFESLDWPLDYQVYDCVGAQISS